MFCFRTQTTIQEIKNKFREQYPYLKLEILGEHTLKSVNCSGNGRWRTEKMISIFPVHSVREVELTLQKELKLPVRIFRKQKDGWMGTHHSFYLSLETQNEMGRLSAIAGVIDQDLEQKTI